MTVLVWWKPAVMRAVFGALLLKVVENLTRVTSDHSLFVLGLPSLEVNDHSEGDMECVIALTKLKRRQYTSTKWSSGIFTRARSTSKLAFKDHKELWNATTLRA
ncbi:hypothetical protein VNO78_34283 [Psophocarpus tetragonolobus]|uniref:Secreted protein n=1 Tax=Psophocarpus tetragonolobus TaxID=3891 RepID=A0AAN9NWA0_PSOTE